MVVYDAAPTAASLSLLRVARSTVMALGVGLAAYLISSTVAMTDTSLEDFAGSLWLVLSQTDFGTTAWVMLAAWATTMIAAEAACVQTRHMEEPKFGTTAATLLYLIGLLIFAYARAATGHVADRGLFSLAALVHTGHILAAGAWVGSIGISILFISGWHTWPTPQKSRLAHRLSSTATIAVPIVAASGLIDAFRTLGDSVHPWGSAYLWLLLAKISLVVVAIIMGTWNRWFWMVRLDNSRVAGAAGFGRVLTFEACVLVIVLMLAGRLGITMIPA